MSRIACLFVPLFPLAARLRSEPDLLHEAVAIVEGSGTTAHVVAATRRARKKGVRPGQSLPQARSLLPKLIARGRDSACEQTAQEALVEVAETFSPRIEDADGGLVFFDVSGMERHFASEHELASAAIHACSNMGLPARAGIAASKLAARVAAESPHSPVIVSAGSECDFLAPLPLSRLTPELDAAATLRRWGLSSIGELARLPEAEIASRLGELGRELHHAARGIDPRPLIPRPLPPEFREGMELEWPLVALEPFLFIAASALERLALRLEMQGFACRRLELSMRLEPDGHHARSIELPAPTRDVKTMLTLLRLDLEKTPPGAPVAGFTLTAHPDRPRRAQLSLFGPAALSPEKLAATIARLVSLLGEDRVGMACAVDGHLPERFAVGAYDPPPPPDAQRAAGRARGILAARVFRPPIPVEVMTRDDRGPATALIDAIRSTLPEPAEDAGGKRITGAQTIIEGSVRVCSGPWQIEQGWWNDEPAAREYWDVELERGGIYRLFRDQHAATWFVDARYD